MATTTLNIQPKYFDFIKKGLKTVEGRIASSSLKVVNVGDTLQFECFNESVACRVVQIGIYESFEKMLNDMGLQNCLPTVTDVAVGVEIYRSFPNYREREGECGVIAFKIQLS